MKLITRFSLPFFLLAAYACGDDDTMGYVPSANGQDATVTSDSGSTPGTDTSAPKTDGAATTDTGASSADTGTALIDAGNADTGTIGGDSGTADTGTVVISACTAANTFAVTNSGSSAYVFSRNGAAAANNPAISLVVGEIYCFNLNVSGHPFWLKTIQGTGTANGILGVVNNGAETGTVIYRPAAPGTFFYNCSQPHPAMTNTVTVTSPVI